MKILEVAGYNKPKAGIIPYYFDQQGNLYMKFMVPSNSAYGGTAFQISKGRVDPGEDARTAAVREGKEESGLKSTNIKTVQKLTTLTVTGLDATYELSIYVAEVKNPNDFAQPHYETGKTEWLTLQDFEIKGRKSQLAIIQLAHKQLSRK